MSRRTARLIIAGLLVFVLFMVLPYVAFVIGAVVIALVVLTVTAGYWYEEAIRAESERISLSMAVEGLEIDNANLAEDLDGALLRLQEVLDEHSLCPAPVDEIVGEVVEIAPKAIRGEVGAEVLNLPRGKRIPAQRKGGES